MPRRVLAWLWLAPQNSAWVGTARKIREKTCFEIRTQNKADLKLREILDLKFRKVFLSNFQSTRAGSNINFRCQSYHADAITLRGLSVCSKSLLARAGSRLVKVSFFLPSPCFCPRFPTIFAKVNFSPTPDGFIHPHSLCESDFLNTVIAKVTF